MVKHRLSSKTFGNSRQDEVRFVYFESVVSVMIQLIETSPSESFFNPALDKHRQFQIAKIGYRLDREKARLVKSERSNVPALEYREIRRRVTRIEELQEEYDDAFHTFLAGTMLPITPSVRRCVFRTFSSEIYAQSFMSILDQYNRWTLHSALYLVDRARLHHDVNKMTALMQAAAPEEKEQLRSAQESLKADYKQRLETQKALLLANRSDLHTKLVSFNRQQPLSALLGHMIQQNQNAAVQVVSTIPQ